MVCTFFGHRNVHKEIEPILKSTLIDLIENHDVTTFYVGNQGGFDYLVKTVLKELSNNYTIGYFVVLAYLPREQDLLSSNELTLYPEGLETVPRRFAISYRNKWMIKHSDYVVTYVTNHIASGAAQFKEIAEKHGKHVINLN